MQAIAEMVASDFTRLYIEANDARNLNVPIDFLHTS